MAFLLLRRMLPAASISCSSSRHCSSLAVPLLPKLHNTSCISHAKPKRIHLLETHPDGSHSTFALRVSNQKDLKQMLADAGLFCLLPASKDGETSNWRIDGDGTRTFADLRPDGVYMMRPSNNLRATVRNMRGELANRARGEEGELTEAILRVFGQQGYEGMVSKKEWRIIENEEVDAVLVSPTVVVIGFHCNKLTLQEVNANFKRVVGWKRKAENGSKSHAFLLGKEVYVVLSGNYLPDKEARRVITSATSKNAIILLKNGANFSMYNSSLPKQRIVPANIRQAPELR